MTRAHSGLDADAPNFSIKLLGPKWEELFHGIIGTHPHHLLRTRPDKLALKYFQSLFPLKQADAWLLLAAQIERPKVGEKPRKFPSTKFKLLLLLLDIGF
jgi:hypothetical protein